MNCSKHSNRPAIAVCPSCGRQICEKCTVVLANIPHCKRCTSRVAPHIPRAQRKRTKPVRVPIPKGKPRRGYFLIGALGGFPMVFCWVIFFIFWIDWTLHFAPIGISGTMLEFALFAIGVGMIISAVGFFGFYINYGSKSGLACTVGLVGSTFIHWAFIYWTFYINTYPPYLFASFFIMDFQLILMAIGIRKVRYYTAMRIFPKLTPILLIASAFAFWTLLFIPIFIIGTLVLLAASISLIFTFYNAKIPVMLPLDVPPDMTPSADPFTTMTDNLYPDITPHLKHEE